MDTSSHFLGIDHHSIVIGDVAKSLDFYTRIVGLESDPERPELPFDGIWLRVGDQAIHCLCVPNPDPVEGRPSHGGRDRHVCLRIHQLQPLIDRLNAASIAYTTSRSGRAAIFFRDPDGNAIEVMEVT